MRLTVPVIDTPILLNVGFEGEVATASLVRYLEEEYSVCHIPPGNPDNRHTIQVDYAALSAHLGNHGDTFGPCPEDRQLEFKIAYLSIGALTQAHYGANGEVIVTKRGFWKGTANLTELLAFGSDVPSFYRGPSPTQSSITVQREVECLPGECPGDNGGSGDDSGGEDGGGEDGGGEDGGGEDGGGEDGGGEDGGNDDEGEGSGGKDGEESPEPDTCNKSVLKGYDDTIDVFNRQKRATNASIDGLEGKLSTIEKALGEANDELEDARDELETRRDALSDAKAEVARKEGQLNAAIGAMNEAWEDADSTRNLSGAGCLLTIEVGALGGPAGLASGLVGCAFAGATAVESEIDFRRKIKAAEDASEALGKATKSYKKLIRQSELKRLSLKAWNNA